MNWHLVLAFIGAAAWLSPWLYEVLRRPRLHGKLVSLSFSQKASFSTTDLDERPVRLDGIGYIVKLSLTITGANLPVRNVRVFVQYPGSSSLVEGKLYFTHNYTLTFGGVTHRLMAGSSGFVQFINHLPKDGAIPAYAMFIVPRDEFARFTRMEFRFYGWKDDEYAVRISAKDLDVCNIGFDDSIWELVETAG